MSHRVVPVLVVLAAVGCAESASVDAAVTEASVAVPPPIDSDGDGLTDDEEVQIGTNPNLADTDGDGVDDKTEIDNGGNPWWDGDAGVSGGTPVDTDGDGLTDDEERQLGTNPNLADTDGGGVDDKTELDAGGNPWWDGDDGNLGGGGATLVPSVHGGEFVPFAAYAASGVVGAAWMARHASGETVISLHVEGLAASTAHPVHVHELPCDVQDAGGHYKIDPTIATTEEDNEVWPLFTTDADGVGQAYLSVDHTVRPEGQSIVVHDPAAGNAKLACADLLPAAPTSGITSRSGDFAAFAAAETLDQSIGGTIQLSIEAGTTTVTWDVVGLDPAETYTSHVHALPCDVDDAGGHYKIDPSVAGAIEANELWPAISPDGAGNSVGASGFVHSARPDAQSVVIHRAFDGGNPKVACADLVPDEDFRDFETSGVGVPLADGTARGFGAATAIGQMARSIDVATFADLAVDGLDPDTTYPVHVHDRTCGLNNGGGHYKIDDTEPGTVEANEFWLPITTDFAGRGFSSGSWNHLGRAEAISMVIHDPADGARLICVDLESP